MQGNFMCRSMLVLHQKMEEYSEKLVSRYGKLILRTTEIMERVRERVGLPAMTPHTLRHQRCTILKRAGVDLDDIALIAGHKSTRTTRLYIHLAPTDLSKRIRTKVETFDAPIRALIEQTLGKAGRS
jgi:integrase